MKNFLKSILPEWFKENQVKNILDMNEHEFRDVKENLAMFIADKIIGGIESLSIADVYDIQALAKPSKKQLKEKREVENFFEKMVETPMVETIEENVSEPKRRGRRPKEINCTLYKKLLDIPEVDNDLIYVAYTRKNGRRVKPLYAVRDTTIPANEARNNIRLAYSKKVKTNYLNVSCRQIHSKEKKMKKTAMFYEKPSSSK